MIAPESTAAQASPSDWQDIFALLDTALDLDPGAQAAWLASLAPGQTRLSPLLKELLQVHAVGQTDDFMPLPAMFAWPEIAAGVAELAAQSLVGPYRLVREIGQGGMASVWLAERADGLLDRQVALKLPHLSWGGASFADRMARERNILASLTHPNIARLYDAGIATDGRPFLALEYVAGLPIDAYARARQLALRERIGLIVQVARAVAHAHARLVVHRDLKPSNILVDERGQAHLLDFGIAKLIDPQFAGHSPDAPLTQAPARALTPDYASPEQIRGEAIGTASDIYSLGVVLFELLVGERPYRLKKDLNAVALALAIEQAEAPRASDAAANLAPDPALRRQLKGDLDAILARALAKASGERYATIDALADDLERHLRGEPVVARPDSRWYRAERWVRRHKLETAVGAAIVVAVPAGAAAQAAVLVAIAAGAGVALWQARLARQQAQIAKDEAARAAAVKAFLTSFFKSGSLEEDGGARLGQLSVQQFVERGARKIELGFEQAPALKNELFDVVSTLFADLSDGTQTVEYARKWQSSLEQFGATELERAGAAQRLAQGLALLGSHAEAAGVLTQAIARLRLRMSAVHGPLLAHLLVDLANLRSDLGDLPSAFAGVDEALELLKTPGDAAKSSAAVNAEALYLRAELMATSNRLAEALPNYEAAIAAMERVYGNRSLAVAKHRFSFATYLASGHQSAAAEREFRHAMQLFHDAGGQADLNAAIVKIYLGRMLAKMQDRHGLRAEGLRLLMQAREVFASRAGDVSPIHAAQANLYLAEGLIDDGELEAARAPMAASMALLSHELESPRQRSAAQMIQARFLSECGDYDAAMGAFEAARTELLNVLDPAHPSTAGLSYWVGLVHLNRHELEKARAVFETILSAQDNGAAAWLTLKRLARMSLAMTQLEQGAVEEALPVLQDTFNHYHANPDTARFRMSEAEVSLNLGRAHLQLGNARSALPLLQRSVDAMQANHPRSPALASNRCWLGLCCLALGDSAQAQLLAEQARQAFDAQPSAGIHYRRSLLLLTERLAATAKSD